ncbi:MAG: hypothetical protein IT374_00275 [Polyangiaceae bacterium]|nr:hypothetical protein [Polyangiaceae bacterium]
MSWVEPSLEALTLARVRRVAWLAVAATLLSRALLPALRGAVVGDAWIARAEWAAGALAQLLLLALTYVMGLACLATARTRGASLLYRASATTTAATVTLLATMAAFAPLTGVVAVALGVAAVATGILGAAQAVQVPASRALGLVLLLLSVSSATRQLGAHFAEQAALRGLLRVLGAARWVATAAFALQALTALFALLWLATRERRAASLWTSVATAAALFASFFAVHVDRLQDSPARLVVARATLALARPQLAFAPVGMVTFVSSLTTLLALAALLGRGSRADVLAALALALVGGADADLPLAGLALAVGALAAGLVGPVARDGGSATFST